MGDTDIPQFPGNLDPRAQEFIPGNHHLPPLLSPHAYYSYPSPSPYQIPIPLVPPPFFDSSLRAYPPPFSSPTAYVSSDHPLERSVSSLPSRTKPSRALVLSMVPAEVSESTVRRDLEVFGDVRAVQMERVRDGIVTVHFYNLRQARQALEVIQEQHMQQQYRLRRHYEAVLAQNSFGLDLLPSSHPLPPLPPPSLGLISGRAVWAQFTGPVASSLPDGNNQGTLVVFNLDPEVTTSNLKQIFEAFGPVKELRETPMKRHQRFVEFYDTRDASKALAEMNGKEIHGKRIVIEFSRPGGIGKKFSNTSGGIASSRLNYWGKYSETPFGNLQQSPPPPPLSPPLPRRASPTDMPLRGHHSQAQQFSNKRSCYSKRSPKGSGHNRSLSSGSLQNSMASMSVNDADGGNQEFSNFRRSIAKKNCKKNGNLTSSTGTSMHQQQQIKGSSRPWKGSRQLKEYDPRFLINEDGIMESNSRDSRTTVMIKNIPNKYSQKLLLNMLDNHCIHCNEQLADGDDQPLSSYDFVYLPIDFINKCNVGYGFVNMTSPEATWRLYKAFHRQSWEVFNSKKICEVTYARLQGVEALKEHFKNSKFPCEADEYMPVVFSPPRDGRLLTEPVPIFGRCTFSLPLLLSSSSPAVSSKDDSEDGEIEGEDFQDLRVVDEVNGHIDVSHDNDDVDGDEDVNISGGSTSSNSNGGDNGEYYAGGEGRKQ